MQSRKLAPRLLGKSALVTGASRGIGRAVALRFALEGASVAISHLGDAARADALLAELEQASMEAEHTNVRHLAFDSDAGGSAAIIALVAATIARFGRLDILVNNAGIQAPTPGDRFDEETYSKILAVNLNGAALAARETIAHFLSRTGGGCIINTTSVHEIIPKPGYIAYAIAKAGLAALTRTLALEFAERGIRVNAVGPGAIATDMNAAWADDADARTRVSRHIPMQRAAEAAEIAPVFAFLASDDASYITGQTIFACGGLTLYGDFKENWAS